MILKQPNIISMDIMFIFAIRHFIAYIEYRRLAALLNEYSILYSSTRTMYTLNFLLEALISIYNTK